MFLTNLRPTDQFCFVEQITPLGLLGAVRVAFLWVF